MNITDTDIEQACKFLLQKNLTLEFNDKVLKRGKLLLFFQKNFYITFLLNNDKKERDKIELPLPYNVEVHEEDELVYFDYRVKTLCKYSPDLENLLKVYASKTNGNKFWNSILTISSK
jgi:hypothetical protein